MTDELILVEEDNEKNRVLFRDILQTRGYKTLEAETGEEAIVLLNDFFKMTPMEAGMEAKKKISKIGVGMFLFLLILIALTFSTNLYAQTDNKRFVNISTEEGLSNPSVSYIAQDSKGFLWFATQNGLNKYDGYSFTLYENDPEDSNSLSSNMIQTMYLDRSDCLWIGTGNRGLDRLDINTKKFTHYDYQQDYFSSLSDNLVIAICEDESGNLWIGTAEGLNRLDKETEQFTRYFHDPEDLHSLPHNTVRAVHKDKNGSIWVGTYGGLSKYNREQDSFINYKYEPDNENSLPANAVMSIYEDEHGFLWLGTWPLPAEKGGLVRFEPEGEQFIRYIPNRDDHYALGDERVYVVYGDSYETIWIGTYGGGLYEFDRKRERFTEYKHDHNNPDSLSHDVMYSIFEDRSGILWFGTNGGGLNKYNRRIQQFGYYRNDPNDPNSVSYGRINFLYEDTGGKIWIGTHNGGLNEYDRNKNLFHHYRHDPDNINGISNDNVNCLIEDSAGDYWIGTDMGLNKLNKNKEMFEHFMPDPDDKNSISDHIIYALYEDSSNNLWIGTYNKGLNRFDRVNNQFIHYKHNPEDPNSISSNKIHEIYQDRKGNIWIGTNNGLNKFDNGRFHRYQHDPNNENSLSSNVIIDIYEDEAGALWIGTAGGGLNRFEVQSKRIAHYTKKDGLPDNQIVGILSDDRGNLWLATGKGLSKFNPLSGEVINYNVDDGLQGDSFNSAYKTRDGDMYFGGINGFNRFYPDSIESNMHIPPVLLTGFKIFNREVEFEKPVWEVEEIEVPWRDKFISFEFVALDYTAPSKNQYAYKLEGFDRDWIYPTDQRTATYTNLDGGKYTFRVKASNNDGIWNEKGLAFKLTVVPPFWLTNWFRVLAGVFLLVLVFAAYKLRIRGIEIQRQKLEHLVAERTGELQKVKEHLEDRVRERTNELTIAKERAEEMSRYKSAFLASMSHELRTPLNSIIGFTGIILQGIVGELNDEQRKQLNMVCSSSKHLLRLVDDILDISKIEAEKVEIASSRFELAELIQVVERMVSPMAEEKGLTLGVTVSDGTPSTIYSDKNRIKKVLINLLSNAIKFTESGEIELMVRPSLLDSGASPEEFEKEELSGIKADQAASLVFSVTDVFDEFKQIEGSLKIKPGGTGLGLAISRTMVEMMGGRIWVESEHGKGSCFQFTVSIEVKTLS